MACMARRCRGWLVVLWLATLFVAGPAGTRAILAFDSGRQPVELRDAGDAWLADDAFTSIQDIARDPNIAWQPTADGKIYPLERGQALWIRFTVPPTPSTERWYLEIPYSGVDRVTM